MLIPVIDKYFSRDELKEAIRFYSTNIGRKLLNNVFLQDLGKVGSNIETIIEQDFSQYKNKET